MTTFTTLLKRSLLAVLMLAVLMIIYGYYVVISFDTITLPENHGRVQSTLFFGDANLQPKPLIVGLGGGDGGNGWAGPHGAKQRAMLDENGYAFLSIAYFGVEETPSNLDRIAIEGVHKAVLGASLNEGVNENCIAVMGVSRGGELALLLGSFYSEYKSVIGIVPGSAVFASLTSAMTTAGFSHNGVPLPFAPVPWSATLNLVRNDLRGTFEKIILNTEAMEAAAIKVEDISGPILLISSTQDEQWPSMEMSDAMMERLENSEFPYVSRHIPLEGGHNEHHDEFEQVIEFLDAYLLSQPNCSLD